MAKCRAARCWVRRRLVGQIAERARFSQKHGSIVFWYMSVVRGCIFGRVGLAMGSSMESGEGCQHVRGSHFIVLVMAMVMLSL